jgi:3-deoxy-D-manno-octulosonic-acid transferase
MWKIIYNLLIHIILPFFVVFSFTKKKIRKNLLERFFPGTTGKNLKGVIWIHAASIGEAIIAENLVIYMKKHTDVDRFLITTNTYYTKDLLHAKLGHEILVSSLPFDLTYSIQRFINNSTFKALIIIETEIWPNLVWEAKKQNIPVIIINGRISDKTLKNYRRFSFFLKHVLSDIALVLAQSEEHMNRFISIGMNPHKVMNIGNLKYYREIEENLDELHKDNIVTFGSIKEKEIDIVLSAIKMLERTFPEVLVFIAPRELHLITVIEKELGADLHVMRYSIFKKSTDKNADVVVVDTVGELLGIYRMSKVSFVGGSLAPYGGQNILEPLFFGTPVVFGPYVENFKDIAKEVIECKAGIMVKDTEELYGAIEMILNNETLRERMGKEGRGIIERQKEVMARTVSIIMEAIKQN